MSMEEAGKLPETPDEKKKNARRPAKTRKHLLTTAYKQDLADKLDKLAAAGHTVLAIVASGEIRGFEVVSYTEE